MVAPMQPHTRFNVDPYLLSVLKIKKTRVDTIDNAMMLPFLYQNISVQ